jgi:hypothetical protein
VEVKPRYVWSVFFFGRENSRKRNEEKEETSDQAGETSRNHGHPSKKMQEAD